MKKTPKNAIFGSLRLSGSQLCREVIQMERFRADLCGLCDSVRLFAAHLLSEQSLGVGAGENGARAAPVG